MSIELVMLSNHLILCCPFFCCLQSFPASGSSLMSQLFALGGQSTGTAASASVLLMNIQDWFPLGLTGLIFQSKDCCESTPTSQFKSINSLALSLLYGPILIFIHDYWKIVYVNCNLLIYPSPYVFPFITIIWFWDLWVGFCFLNKLIFIRIHM